MVLGWLRPFSACMGCQIVEPAAHVEYQGHPETIRTVQDFFGGITIFSRQQFERVNGYGVDFWGWGREDDNMRERLRAADMWPPERPAVPKRHGRWYFEHQRHLKAPEVTASQVV